MAGTIDMVAESIAFNDPTVTYIQWDNSIGDYLRFANTGNDGFYFGDPALPNGVEISDSLIVIQSNVGNPSLRFENTTAVGTCTIRPETTTAARTITLPDESGTVALLSDIPFIPSSTEYTALLTQVGTSAPTESVLNDTLTSGVWSYSSVGHYHYTKVGAFTNVDKVEVRIETNQLLFMSMTNSAFNMMSASRVDNDTILVKTANVGYVGGTGKGLTDPTLAGTITDFLVDDVLSNTPITIRVWS